MSQSQTPRPLLPSLASQIPPLPKPDWLRIQVPTDPNYWKLKELVKDQQLHTVCEEARCPNIAECWSGGTATFLLGGNYCTRACRFCAVKTLRRPPPLDPAEPQRIAESVLKLNLTYAVLTGVDRDDLPDGGAEHFAKTVQAVGHLNRQPRVIVEALVSDFRGAESAIRTLVASGVDVYAHNLETVERLQYRVRDPRANYQQSLKVLGYAKNYASELGRTLFTKSSLMVGLGESREDLASAFSDLRKQAVDILTLGQYLRPSPQHLPVERYVTPQEFEDLADYARTFGFLQVVAGPLVRSSYRAGEFFLETQVRRLESQRV